MVKGEPLFGIDTVVPGSQIFVWRLADTVSVPTGPRAAARADDNALAFLFEAFIDKLVYSASKDPLQFQIDLLGKDELLPGRVAGFNTARARRRGKTSQAVGLGPQAAQSGTGLCVAAHCSHLCCIAEIVEAAVAHDGAIKINKVWAAGDTGSHVVNPTQP